MDRQVKIRGYRIELTGIEAVLEKHPEVREAAVGANGSLGNEYLSAYIVPRSATGPTTEELQRFLRRKLPTYMVPRSFHSVSELPLTASGKVDR